MKYLIITHDKVASIIDVPSGTSSDDYGTIQEEFAKQHAASVKNVYERYAHMVRLDPWYVEFGIYYDYSLAGADGAWFTLFKLPDDTQEDLKNAKAKIRRDHDVVRLDTVIIKKLVNFQPQVDIILTPSGVS